LPNPTPIPWPTSSFPGNNPQESAGRLINVYAEPLGEGGPGKWKWIRSPGLSQFAATENSGYRGGLIVNNLSYETWANVADTVTSAGVASPIGTGLFPGTKKVSIARNNASPTPDVVAVDLDNGAYILGSAAVGAASATATIGLPQSGARSFPGFRRIYARRGRDFDFHERFRLDRRREFFRRRADRRVVHHGRVADEFCDCDAILCLGDRAESDHVPISGDLGRNADRRGKPGQRNANLRRRQPNYGGDRPRRRDQRQYDAL
jgi:hypothetical protein